MPTPGLTMRWHNGLTPAIESALGVLSIFVELSPPQAITLSTATRALANGSELTYSYSY